MLWMVGGWDVRGMLIRESLACFFGGVSGCDSNEMWEVVEWIWKKGGLHLGP